MESSEDDAGTATSASRCASAREKDVGQIEDVESTSNYQQESSEARASCGTPSMSEDNFDGDSVPSPSAQDVNTSTEAILDMIDEFVDGPGAPKRIPCADDYTPSDPVPPAEDTHKSVSQEQDTQNAEQAQQPLPSANSEPENIATESENKINNSECTSESEQPTESLSQSDVNSECAPLDTAPQISVIGENAPVDLINESESNHSEVAAETETLSVLSASSLPSSSVQTDQSEPSDCERTVKIVTSSDNRDNVTVEKAESTSSECSVSESKPPVVEQLTRSPLRRRLVRPAPNDRRPDSTVSSTVDTTQTVDIDTPQQETCESVTKDVSSSSDAVPIHHGNTKPEEISNVSEISVCKAETTTIPSKKIKLIRPKIISVLSNRISETKSLTPEKDPCQSTSSEDQSIPNEVPPPTVVPQIETNDLSKQDNVEEKSEVECNKPTVENLTPETVEVSPETSSNVTVNSENTEVNVPEVTEVKVTVKDQDEELPEQSTSDSSRTVQEVPILEKQNEDSSSNVTENVEDKKVPPIKLSLSKSHQELQDTENQSSKNVEAPEKEIVDTQTSENVNCGQEPVLIQNAETEPIVEERKVPPFKLNLSSSDTKSPDLPSPQKSSNTEEDLETKLVPKLTIKLGNKSSEEPKSPKLSIKPLRPSVDESPEKNANQIASITKINIKPIVKPIEKVNDVQETDSLEKNTLSDQIPNVTKLNIKPIPRPPEKINDIHRKSSSSEISESEYSENDDTSTSDQASTSDQGSSETVPKVTIKLGRPGTESEGKFYTEQQNIPKLTIKNIQQGDKEEQDSKLKLIISQSEDKFSEKVPKLTIKTVATKSEGQPLSPKLTIKPIKPPDGVNKESEIPKLKISTESFSGSPEIKENVHVPKITIKPVTKTDADNVPKTPKKSSAICDNTEHIPVVTKLNIKPIMKPESVNDTEDLEDKVPVVSKLNIKPVVRPKDNEVESSVEDVPKVIKLNIKPIKNPEEKSSDKKDCDEMHADMDDSIPVVTKLNIKPIVKPAEDEGLKDSENQSSETGNSSDDNGDHIPVVTKLNIKPIVKPNESEGSPKPISSNEQNIPVVTKLNIKPLVKPDESSTPSSPKKESLRSPGNSSIPVITKLNIKPIIRPDELNESKTNIDISERLPKNPPLVMKINIKNVSENNMDHEHLSNNIERTHSPKHSPKLSRSVTSDSNNSKSVTLNNIDSQKNASSNPASPSLLSTCDVPLENESNINSVPEEKSASSQDVHSSSKPSPNRKQVPEVTSDRLSESLEVNTNPVQINEVNETNNMEHSSQQISPSIIPMDVKQAASKQKKSIQNCTLLKKLLSSTKEEMEKSQSTNYSNCLLQCVKSGSPTTNCNDSRQSEKHDKNVEAENTISASYNELDIRKSPSQERSDLPSKHRSIEDVQRDANESVTKPLEISVTDKVTHQSSGQDSPRIILKINKTDHGPSAKIITEEFQKPSTSPTQIMNTYEAYDAHTPKKQIVNRIRKQNEESASLTIGKRLRSSRIMDTSDKSPGARRNAGKRPSMTESSSPATNKDSELSILDSKRLKLEQILSANKSLTITPVVVKNAQTSPGTENKQGAKTTNHTMVNNENCPKNGNSKLHNILTNLQAKQMHSLQMNDSSVPERAAVPSEADNSTTTSTASSDVVVEITRIDNCHPEVQEMIIQNADYRDHMASEEAARDPLDTSEAVPEEPPPPEVKPVEVTPLPRKRGRPRKLPVSEGAKLEVTPLPVPALEERPQRSLRLTRERPAILTRPRGRGRGRGARRLDPAAERSPARAASPRAASPEDPTSSRIKLPRMTEALDKSTGTFSTPLSHRRASAEPEEPEAGRGRARGRPARGRSPRARGRGRGGGRGATYMKETMGIYGRVCGPATTTVELFEEETCMMDDNATPSKPSHLLDEDSQSSVKSSTNDSHRMKKSKFADIFDSNKVWTAGDVKEYTWPPPDTPNMEPQVMMIQEQVAMFLGVKSFKRRYPELKRRTVVAEERDYVLSKGIVTEALCDLGITAVDASEVLDIMLSDYPHKYEEYRSHQRERQLAESSDEAVEPKIEEKPVKVEVKPEKPPEKPEPPKVDPEKARQCLQEMAAAAAASASEWNSRLSVWRRAACADLQSWSVQRPRAAPAARPRVVVAPPGGFYPLALLPGQYQHAYRHYTPEQLRYFPLNTVLSAPPAAPSPAESCSESEGEWGDHSSSSDHSDQPQHHAAKRKKLTKVKRSSQQEKDKDKEDSRGASTSAGDTEVVDTCRVCKLRLEANRKYTHERFLVCANCNAKLHPSCVDLGPDTIRKCREYAWQCAECKSCCGCRLPADDDKMLFCDLCDRGFHIYCVGLDQVPNGRWHCVECAICKSCGAREPSGLAGAAGSAGAGSAGSSSTPGTPGTTAEAEWHHQTRRGPGGHKVYSHSLCTPCARAYRIGRYCPLCERSFIGPKGTMQLVICKLCDRQLHQECVRRTVSALKVLDYTCARCRRGGITSRAAAVRLAPRTIATLFMAKRRFNKYAHRQYLQTRLAAAPDDDALD